MSKASRSYYALVLLCLCSLLLPACSAPAAVRPLPPAVHTTTEWSVEASLPLDALAFLNTLSGDALVGGHYAGAVRHFQAMLTPEVRAALKALADFREQRLRSNLSGFLCTHFLAGEPDSLDDLIALAADPEPIRQALRDYDASGVDLNVFYTDQRWQLFTEALPNVRLVLIALRNAGFEAYWRAEVLPGIETEAARIRAAVEGYNIVPEVERLTGFGLPDSRVTIYLLHYVWPYGHHLIGPRFVTIPEDTDTGILRTTIHELLHNPFNGTDPAFWNAVNRLKTDPFVKQHFEGRDPKFGYNDWGYYVAEDSVRALEEIIGQGMGLGRRWTWREDGGMHVLAAALAALMKQEGFPRNAESYQAFVIRMVDEGKLAPGKIEALWLK